MHYDSSYECEFAFYHLSNSLEITICSICVNISLADQIFVVIYKQVRIKSVIVTTVHISQPIIYLGVVSVLCVTRLTDAYKRQSGEIR